MPDEILYRSADAEAETATDGRVAMTISTCDACCFGSWSESLSHDDGAVDVSATHTVLLNHNPDAIVGRIDGVAFDGKRGRAKTAIMPDARTVTGVSVLEAIKTKALVGVSIGYTYKDQDCDVDEDRRTVHVRKWRLLEVSVTPTPRDTKAHVRSFPTDQLKSRSVGKEGKMAEENKPAPVTPAPAEGDEKARAEELRQLRAENLRNTTLISLRNVAQSHGVPWDPTWDKTITDEAAGLRMLLDQKSAADLKRQTNPPPPVPIDIVKDQEDKFRAAIQDGLDSLAGVTKPTDKDQGLRIGSGLSLIEHMARRNAGWSSRVQRDDIVAWALAPQGHRTRGGLITTGEGFTYLLADSLNKSVMGGFGAGGTTWRQWCSMRQVANYLAFKDLALQVGRLSTTPEGQDHHAISYAEESGGSTLLDRGGVVSLTEQVLVNDDLGEWLRSLANYGRIADRTVEYNAVTAALAYDYTTNTNIKTTAGALSVASLGTLQKVMTGMYTTLRNGDKEFSGGQAKLLLVPPTLYNDAYGIATPGPGALLSTVYQGIIIPVSVPLFEIDTGITGYSSDDYYIAEEPSLNRGMRVAYLAGRESPWMEELPQGKASAREWLLRFPHVAYMATKFGWVKGDKA
jgi:HK97 family phage prohead protease